MLGLQVCSPTSAFHILFQSFKLKQPVCNCWKILYLTKFIYFYFICTCNARVLGAREQKTVIYPLELELQGLENHRASAGTQTQALCKSTSHSYCSCLSLHVLWSVMSTGDNKKYSWLLSYLSSSETFLLFVYWELNPGSCNQALYHWSTSPNIPLSMKIFLILMQINSNTERGLLFIFFHLNKQGTFLLAAFH